MSRIPRPLETEPGPECYCGEELKSIPLPPDIAEASDRKTIWVHVHNGDTLCYPDSDNPEDRSATADPADPQPECQCAENRAYGTCGH